MATFINRVAKVFILAGLVGVLAACAAGPNDRLGFTPAPQASAGSALLYFYRPDGPRLGATPQIKIDGQPVTLLEKERYTWVYVSEGEHHIAIDWPDQRGDASELAFDLAVDHDIASIIRVTTQIKSGIEDYKGGYLLRADRVHEIVAYSEMYDCCEFSPSYHYGLGVAL